jgi:hypothetical protein
MLQGIGAGLVLFCQMATGAPEPADEPSPPAAPAAENKPIEKASIPVISEATVSFRNDVGDKFQLMQGRFSVDGIDLPAVPLDPTPGRETVIFRGPMTSGRHVITSHLTYQGRNRAIFTYLKGYTFNIDAKDEVFVVSGALSSATVVAHEQKGFTVPYEKSLTVDFDVRGAMTDAVSNGTATRRASR